MRVPCEGGVLNYYKCLRSARNTNLSFRTRYSRISGLAVRAGSAFKFGPIFLVGYSVFRLRFARTSVGAKFAGARLMTVEVLSVLERWRSTELLLTTAFGDNLRSVVFGSILHKTEVLSLN